VDRTGDVRLPQQERSAARCARLLDAAAAIMTEAGLAAVTYRAVAARAGVPFSSVAYYFPTTEDLLAAAGARLEAARAEYAVGLLAGPRAPRGPAEAARLVVAVQLGERSSDALLQGTYSWLVQAGQHPRLAAALRAARPLLDVQLGQALVMSGYPDFPVERALNIIDGAVVLSLVEGHPGIAQRAVEALAGLLREASPRA
jgi:DNA-binding transcriptional regulator YbjK